MSGDFSKPMLIDLIIQMNETRALQLLDEKSINIV